MPSLLLVGCLLDWQRLQTGTDAATDGSSRAEGSVEGGQDGAAEVGSEPRDAQDEEASAASEGGLDGDAAVSPDAQESGPADAQDANILDSADSALDAQDANILDSADSALDVRDASVLDSADSAVDAPDAADVADASDAADAAEAGCTAASQCPGTDTECSVRTCLLGACGRSFTMAGTAVAMQTAGDCRRNQCDGMGSVQSVADNADVPVDGNQCTNDVCTAGVPSNPSSAARGACSSGGGTLCNGMGLCVQCLAATDCPGADTACRLRTCTAGVCGTMNVAAGTTVAMQTAGDCHRNQCDGMGSVQNVVDNADVPVDGNQCTQDLCTAGVPSNPNSPARAACSSGSGALCSGTGVCVQCLQLSDCASGQYCTTLNTCAPIPPLVLSQVQTRGSNGGSDEFIEIYNPTSAPVTFDSNWGVWGRSAVTMMPLSVATCAMAPGVASRITGAGQVIPAHGHLLFGNTTYSGSVGFDAPYTSSTGFVDGGAITLQYGSYVVDALCYYFDAASQANLMVCAATYRCEGNPVSNAPHTNSASFASDVNVSLERRPGGALGNGQDTNDNSADWVSRNPSTPRNSSSPPAP